MGIDTDVNGDNKADLLNLAWIAREDNAHPLEYYLNQKNNSNESKNKDKDYSNNNLLFSNMIEGQFY
jgi:hypothetical protein